MLVHLSGLSDANEDLFWKHEFAKKLYNQLLNYLNRLYNRSYEKTLDNYTTIYINYSR